MSYNRKLIKGGEAMSDNVSHPAHYLSGPKCECGRVIECITITRHRDFVTGSIFKYLWRAGLKKSAGMSSLEKEIQDLEKASWYLADRIKTLKSALSQGATESASPTGSAMDTMSSEGSGAS